MTRIIKVLLAAVLMAFTAEAVMAQQNVRELHKVKKKETIFGIARQYGLTIQELVDANPEMNTPGYELKKDSYITIPYSKSAPAAPVKAATQTPAVQPLAAQAQEAKSRPAGAAIRLGVMLPLHDINGDGRRMVEYYRGVLMACDSLKKQGISVSVHAWNTPDDQDIAPVLRDPEAKQCDMIIGPLYSKQMAQLSEFVSQNDIRLIIPFSINAPQLQNNRNMFQVYQSPTFFNQSVISQFMRQFAGYHPVFIDCNDTTSTKGIFTGSLRRKLELEGVEYSLTNLKSSEQNFAKAFSRSKPNVVVLNSGRAPELNVAMAKLNGLSTSMPEIKITLMGFTEWLMYTKQQLDNFYKYNAYIPATYHFTPLTSNTASLQRLYRQNFHQDMIQSLPRFAITGFDHAMYFIQGFHRYGKSFTGAPGILGYKPVQTPLKFERLGNGGLRNTTLVMMHYLPEHRMETINL